MPQTKRDLVWDDCTEVTERDKSGQILIKCNYCDKEQCANSVKLKVDIVYACGWFLNLDVKRILEETLSDRERRNHKTSDHLVTRPSLSQESSIDTHIIIGPNKKDTSLGTAHTLKNSLLGYLQTTFHYQFTQSDRVSI